MEKCINEILSNLKYKYSNLDQILPYKEYEEIQRNISEFSFYLKPYENSKVIDIIEELEKMLIKGV